MGNLSQQRAKHMFLAPLRVVLGIVARRFSASGEKESRGCFIRCSLESHHLAVSLPSEPVYQVISNRMFDVPDHKLRHRGWFLMRWCVMLL